MYPVFLNLTGRLCVVVGGGGVAERKVKGLLQEGAFVRVISPEVTVELAALAAEGKIDWRKKKYGSTDLDKAFLVFAATNHRQIQDVICRQSLENRQLINVADDPACCNFQVPATFRRGDLTLAISTGGKSPAVAAFIREKMEDEFGPEYAVLLDIMSDIRQKTTLMGMDGLSQADRKKIYKKILHNDIINWIKTGRLDELQNHLRNILGPEADPEIKKLKLDH
ncbi:MAG: bifunctional precorrin-2 dehydrogenase/sirohydrochlorin ferrochelatase [Desulfobulbaceae bacterium]|nr:bifunctional precorrin-2 dehydrogenase/sirohydrochlorin ferrochelatase [Desulfobulbaceae bacterium]